MPHPLHNFPIMVDSIRNIVQAERYPAIERKTAQPDFRRSRRDEGQVDRAIDRHRRHRPQLVVHVSTKGTDPVGRSHRANFGGINVVTAYQFCPEPVENVLVFHRLK